MNEKEEYLEKLISLKSFAELNADELSFVLTEVGSEEQYTNLRNVSGYLDSVSPAALKPRTETQQSLRLKFRVVHARPSLFHRLFYTPVPAYATMLVVLAVVLVIMFLKSPEEPKTISIRVPSPADTIRIVTKADTVFINRIKYRYIRQKADPIFTIVYPKHIGIIPDSTLSVSMKDKAELDNLLVTGVN